MIVIQGLTFLMLAALPLLIAIDGNEREGRYWAEWEKKHASEELRRREVADRER